MKPQTEKEENETNAQADFTEDLPEDVPPADRAPELTNLPLDEQPKPKHDRLKNAMEILDEYEEGVPQRDSKYPHHEE